MIRKPSAVARARTPSARRASTVVSIRSDSFARSSSAPRSTLSPRAHAAASAKSGSSSIATGTSCPSTVVPTSGAACTSRSPAGSAADLAPVVRRDAGAHPLEDPEQARAPRIEVDAVHVELRAGHERRGDDQWRGRGEVTRNLDLAERQPLGGTDADALGPPCDRCAGGLEHPLGVVASRDGLDDRRLAVRIEPGEQDGRLHLRARHRQSVGDRVERAPLHAEGEPSVSALDARTHLPQRIDDPPHRTGAERRVSDELELLPRLTGQDAREQTDERAGVAAVDGSARGGQPAEADARDAQLVVRLLGHGDTARSYGGDRGLGVGRATEACDAGLPFADRADQHRAVRDRLVARDCDVTDESRHGLDVDTRLAAHSSITGAATTP